MEKLELIVKPTQSGKTFIMLQEISKMLNNDDNTIHIIFCDNQLLQTEQLDDRVNKYDDLETYVSEEGDISLILSSTSKIKKYTELTHHITNNLKTIITCSNIKRVGDINKLIDNFSTNKNLNPDYKFSIWIDEIDKNIKLFKKFLLDWDKHIKIERIGLITATPKDVIKTFNVIKILELEESYDREMYQSFADLEFKLLNFNDMDIDTYVQKIIVQFSNLIKEGQVWFVPGEVNITSHCNIKNILIEKVFTVIIINGNGKQIFYDNKSEENLENNNNLADFLGELYINKKLNLKKVAITGNLCISRGITINSDKMLITHAIFPTKINNLSNSYQLAGRICGNIKKFKNYKKPTVFCSLKFKNEIIIMENRAKNLAEKAFIKKNPEVSPYDYKNAHIMGDNKPDNKIQNYGIPILLNINNKDDLKYITDITKISKNTRDNVHNIIKKCKLKNDNIDFDINKFKLRQKETILVKDVNKETGESKYLYKNYMRYYKNKKCREPNENCKPNEYLICIIGEDIKLWDAKAGDAIILYRTN